MSNSLLFTLLSVSTLALSACGGGGGGGTSTPTPTPPAPIVDTTSPILSLSTSAFNVNSAETATVTVSASDNVAVTSGPTVSCTNGGAFANNTFTAPSVTQDTTSVCTVTASDAAGNQVTGTFTATIIAPDTQAPTLTINPTSFNLRSDETFPVSVSAQDNFAVTDGPNVSCTNGGTFASGVFTPGQTTQNTTSICTVAAADAAGNAATGTFTATITAATGFTVTGVASKGLLFGANVRIFDMDDVLGGAALTDVNAIARGKNQPATGGYTLNIDTTESTVGAYLLVDIVLDGAEMVCDSASGCTGGVAFGETFSIPTSGTPVSIHAIIPTPGNQDVTTANVNIFSSLKSELTLERTARADLTQLRTQDLTDAQTQVATLFGLPDQAFVNLDFIDITQTDFDGVDRETLESHIIAGGILGALNESTDPLTEALNRMILDFRAANGEFIGIESADDPDFVSLVDIFENARLLRGANSSLNQELGNAIDEIDFITSELRESEGNARTNGGVATIGAGGNSPPRFVTGIDYSISVNSTSFVQILAGDLDFDPLTYALDATGDGAFFALSTEGELTIAENLDFSMPSDSDADNVYNLVITLSDGKDSRVATIPVTVTDEPVTGFTLTGVASKGLLKGQTIRLSTLMFEEITTGVSSAVDGTFEIGVADNAFFRDIIEISSRMGDGTMACDAPRGCGTGVSFGDDFTITDDQNGTLGALIVGPSGGSELSVHINVFTQLVAYRAPVFNDPEPVNETTIGLARNEVAATFNLTPQNFSALEFVDVTDPNVTPTSVNAAKAALLSAGVLGAALEREGRLENTLDSLYRSFGSGQFTVNGDGTTNRITLVDILTHASEIRDVNASQNSNFIQALDSIDADLATATAN